MPKALKKRKPKPGNGSAPDEHDPGEAKPPSVQEVAACLARQLEFHFTHDKDDGRKVDPAECQELLQALGELRSKLRGVQSGAYASLEQRVEQARTQLASAQKKEGPPNARGPAAYLEMKAQLFLSYLIALTYYLLLKVKGVPIRSHPVVPRLLWIRSLLEKLKPVDQRLQYQINKLMQWNDAKKVEQQAGVPDAHALRPGSLTATVADEEEEEKDEEQNEEEKEHEAYKPPKISQVEYTGDHVSMQEKAEKELERKKARLERSEFMRSLREEFTDAPREVHGEERSARAEKAARLLQEQQEYEEDTMTRLKVKKAEARKQKQALREGRRTSGGAVSLYDAAADFNDILRSAASSRGSKRGRGRGRGGGGVLQEYEEAKRRAHGVRANVAAALDSAPGKRKRGGGGMKGRAKRR